MTTETLTLFAKISGWSIYLPFLLGLLSFKRQVAEQRTLFWLVIVYVITEAIISDPMEWFWEALFGYNNNLPALHVFTVLQFALIVLMYRKILLPRIGSSGIWVLIGGFTAFALYNAFYLDGFLKMNPHARAVQGLVLLPLALYYLSILMRELRENYLERDPLFWISITVIIYFSGNLFIFLSTNYLLSDTDSLIFVYSIHSLLNILSNLLFAIALWVKPSNNLPF